MSQAPTLPSSEAPISAVQVYQRGATVTRTLRLQAPFPEALSVAGLPLSLSPESVRLRLLDLDRESADDDLVIAGVHVGLHVRPRAEAPEAPTAAALRTARQRLARQRDLRSQIQQELNLLGSIQSPSRPRGDDTQAPPMSPMVARVALEAFTHAAISARTTEKRALEVQIEEAQREVAALEDQQRRATDGDKVRPEELSHAAHLRLQVEGAPRAATLALEYFVPGVRWAPTYQCLIDRGAGRVTLQMRAAVVQHSGEDWSDVAVRFSTALPTTRSRLPELASIRIGKAQPPPPAGRGYRPPPEGGHSLFTDFDGARQRLSSRYPAHDPSFSLPPPTHYLHIPEDVATIEAILGIARDEAPRGGYGGGSADKGGGGGWGGGAAGGPAPIAAEAALRAPPPPAPASAPRPQKKLARSSSEKSRSASVREEAESMDVLGADDYFGQSADEAWAGDGDDSDESELSGALGGAAFARLRLPGPEEDGPRGQLVPMTAAERDQRALAAAGARADFDVAGHVAVWRRAAEAVALPGGLTPAESVQGRFDYAYAAENRLDVPGDGAVHVVPVLRWEGPCQVRYVLVPRVEPLAYRQAELVNPSPAPLLPGPVEVYVDGQYAVTAALPLVGAQGRLELGLGAEQAIRIARNAHFQERRSGEKVVAMTELLHDIEIELVNTLPRPARCEVRERIPHPAPGAEVVVDEEAIAPAWEEYTQKERGAALKGGRRWFVTLDPGQTQTLRARYIVKIYANNELVGGNRREA